MYLETWRAEMSLRAPAVRRLRPSQKSCTMVGKVEAQRPRSEAASMDRKLYMGSCKAGSVLTRKRMTLFPRMETTQMRLMGMETQW